MEHPALVAGTPNQKILGVCLGGVVLEDHVDNRARRRRALEGAPQRPDPLTSGGSAHARARRRNPPRSARAVAHSPRQRRDTP
jgi:hypothetical protein